MYLGIIHGTKYSRMDQINFFWDIAFVKDRPYPFKFFKGCLPRILIGPFLNTLSHMMFRAPYELVGYVYECLMH